MRHCDRAISRPARRSGGTLSAHEPRSEDSLIYELRALIETYPAGRRIYSRIGDDAAVWQPSRSHRSIVTTDALVEDVHFRRATMSFYDAGWRSMASNLSDLAAMGARPLLATVALAMPPDEPTANVLELYRGMLDIASSQGCAVAGGDLTRAQQIVVSITAIGEARPSNVKGRGGARCGDVIALTGALGASRAGLHVGEGQTALDDPLREAALTAHRRPQPRVREGMWLAASRHVHAMMDVSDGLSTDLRRMCARSGCAAAVNQVPIAQSARVMASARAEDPLTYALAGGEEYELLLAAAPRAFEHLRRRFAQRFGRPLHELGRFRQGSGVSVRSGDREEAMAPIGWDAFGNEP